MFHRNQSKLVQTILILFIANTLTLATIKFVACQHPRPSQFPWSQEGCSCPHTQQQATPKPSACLFRTTGQIWPTNSFIRAERVPVFFPRNYPGSFWKRNIKMTIWRINALKFPKSSLSFPNRNHLRGLPSVVNTIWTLSKTRFRKKLSTVLLDFKLGKGNCRKIYRTRINYKQVWCQ